MIFNASKLTALLALPVLAVATPWGATTTSNAPVTTTVTATATSTATPVSSCNTGSIQCCNSLEKASSPAVSTLLGLLGVVIQDLNVIVGLTCNPITAIGIGGDSCSAQTVCCENDSFNGLIAIGCTPININL